MKMLLSFLVLASSVALAETPEIRASKVTCAELKEAVANYGSVIVVKKILLFKDKTLVHREVSCTGTYEYQQSHRFKTKDEKSCLAGVSCLYSPPYTPSDDSGGSYSGGSDWGGSWGGSSSSGGSSDRGSSYDPPSRGDRGSSYDPPDRGDRGSRYCPGC